MLYAYRSIYLMVLVVFNKRALLERNVVFFNNIMNFFMLSGMLILTLQATDVKAANPVVLPLYLSHNHYTYSW